MFFCQKTNLLKQAKMKTNNKQKFEGILDKACKSAFEVPSFWKERKHGDEILKFIMIFWTF